MLSYQLREWSPANDYRSNVYGGLEQILQSVYSARRMIPSLSVADPRILKGGGHSLFI